jgi:hypothetical protein
LAQAIASGLPGMFSPARMAELLQLDRDLLSRFWQSHALLAHCAVTAADGFAMTGHAPPRHRHGRVRRLSHHAARLLQDR